MQTQIHFSPAFAVALVHLQPGEIVRSEGGAMVSMNDAVEIKTDTQGGLMRGLKRSVLGGESFFMNTFTATGPGAEVSFAPALPGDIVEWNLAGQTVYLQSGSFLASSDGIDVDSKWGGAKTFFSREGLFMLKVQGTGSVLVSSYGAIQPIDLAPGQTYTVDTGHMVGWSEGVTYEVKKIGGWKSTLLSGEGLVVPPHRSRPHLPADPQPGELPRLARARSCRRRARDVDGAGAPMTDDDRRACRRVHGPVRRRRGASARVPYLPGLDGLRAIAVVAVMVYHADASWLPGRVPRRRGVLRHQRLPDHAAADRRARAVGTGADRPVLRAAGPAAAARRCTRCSCCSRRTRRCSGATRSASCAATCIAGLTYVSNWYQIWVGQGYTATRRLRPAAPPLEPRRRGAVLPALAARDDRHPAPGIAARPGRQLVAGRHRRGHRRASSPSSTTRVRSARAPSRPMPTGRSAGAASPRSTSCTCRRRRGPGACCSAPRWPWSGGRWR